MVEHQIPLATSIIATSCVFALQTIGVDPGPLFWAMVGAAIGMSFAKPTNRGRAAVLFVAVVLACSLFGSWVSQNYLKDNSINRNAASCALAIAFHLLLNAIAQQAPKLFDAAAELAVGFLRRWFPGIRP